MSNNSLNTNNTIKSFKSEEDKSEETKSEETKNEETKNEETKNDTYERNEIHRCPFGELCCNRNTKHIDNCHPEKRANFKSCEKGGNCNNYDSDHTKTFHPSRLAVSKLCLLGKNCSDEEPSHMYEYHPDKFVQFIKCDCNDPHELQDSNHIKFHHPEKITKPDVCWFGNFCPVQDPYHIKIHHPDQSIINMLLMERPAGKPCAGTKLYKALKKHDQTKTCKYGQKCYRKNEEHIAKFHPEKLTSINQLSNKTEVFRPENLIIDHEGIKTIKAGSFVEHILGMREKDFVKQFKFDQKPTETLPLGLDDIFARGNTTCYEWIKEYPMRELIFKGNCQFMSIGELRKLKKDLQREGSFEIIFADPTNPKETEVQFIAPRTPNSTIQVASTPMALAGNSYLDGKTITNIISRPVQDEWCIVVATAQAIYRKYFMPLLTSIKNTFLWEDFLGKADIGFPLVETQHGKSRIIDPENIIEKMEKFFNKTENITVSQTDEILKLLKVVICGDAVISHGEIVIRSAEPKDHLIQLVDNGATVNLVFTSAINRLNFAPKYAVNEYVNQFMDIVLESSYEGAALATNLFAQGKNDDNSRTLLLTLVGASAFMNKMESIAKAITSEHFQKAIQGLHVKLIFRCEKRKYDAQEKYGEKTSERSPEKDFEFLKKVLSVYNKNVDEKLLWKYLELSYGKVGVPIIQEQATEISKIASQLNSKN